MSVLDLKAEVAFSRHHEAMRLLLLDNNLGLLLLLDNNLGLGLDIDLLLLLGLNIDLLRYDVRLLTDDNDSWSTMADTHEFRSHVDKATCVELDSLFTRSVLSEDAEGHVGFTDGLHGVSLIFDDDVHVVLEHVGGDVHELHNPSGFLTTVMGGLRVEDLLANLDVNEGRHLVEGSTDFVVEVRVQNVKLEEALLVHLKRY